MIDDIAAFFDTISERPVTRGESPKQLQSTLGHSPLPLKGKPAGQQAGWDGYKDTREVIGIIAREGKKLHRKLRSSKRTALAN